MTVWDCIVIESVVTDSVGNVFFVCADNFADSVGQKFSAYHFDKRIVDYNTIVTGVDYEYALGYIGLYREGEA